MYENQTPLNQPKVYVASTLSNWKRVRSIYEKLIVQGITITYDWTQWAENIFSETGEINQKEIPSEDKRLGIAWSEVQGVLDANAVLAVMPGERGSHFEMAIAWFIATPIVILLDSETAPRPTSFHSLPRIERLHDEEAAIARTIELAKALHNLSGVR